LSPVFVNGPLDWAMLEVATPNKTAPTAATLFP